jgi:hypothetical protein
MAVRICDRKGLTVVDSSMRFQVLAAGLSFCKLGHPFAEDWKQGLLLNGVMHC